MSRASRNETQTAARRAKLNKLSLLGAGAGAIPGLLGGLVYSSAVISPVAAALLGLINGAMGGVLAALAVAAITGLQKEKPQWWYIVAAILGGIVGQVAITKLIEWLILLGQWVLKTGGLYGIFIFD